MAEEDKTSSKVSAPANASEPKTLRYRYVGDHADTLPGGRPLEIGSYVDLTEDELRHVLVEDMAHRGALIGTDDDSEHQIDLANRRVQRRINNEDGEE